MIELKYYVKDKNRVSAYFEMRELLNKAGKAYDSNGIKENEDFAVFMISSFIVASSYVFKEKNKRI